MKICIGALIALCSIALGQTLIQNAHDAASEAAPATEVLEMPDNIASYRKTGEDIDVGDDVRAALQTSTILMRRYNSPQSLPILLTLVYAGTTRRSLHFPEVCVVGQGWEVRDQSTAPVGIEFSARRLVLVHGNNEEAILYWFKTGDHYTGNYFLNSWYWAKAQLTFGAPTSAMIKLSAPVGRQGSEATFAILEDFARNLAPVVRQQIP
ncbi:MAG: EpsI family protein [Candidatus Hydrogenedentes bacterium]|nr:EpsI family protein [Candidatus Hydrogenedentota bacterium]